MKSDYDKREEQEYEASLDRQVKVTVDIQHENELSSPSTIDRDIYVDSATTYFVNLSDIHIPEGNMYVLADTLKKFARIPNLYFGFGGDQINNSIKPSVGDSNKEVIDPEKQIKLLAHIIRKVDKQVPILDRIAFIQAGNHENRTEKTASINPTYLLASELGLQTRYAKNIAKINFINNKRENPNQKIQTLVLAHHGEQKPGKAGAQAEDALRSDLDQGADVVTYGHNHKIAKASSYKQFPVPNKKDPIQKEVVYVNFGAYVAGSEYADQAGYPFPRVSDMEILRITNVGGEKKYDLVNYRSLVEELATEKIDNIEKVVSGLEKSTFTSEEEIKKAYLSSIKETYKLTTQGYKSEREIKEKLVKESGVSDKLYFAPLSGFKIGDENYKSNDKDIKKKIDVLSKLNGSCKVVLNGDIIFYKKAFTLVNKNGNLLGEKFPEESFAYLVKAAKLLKPIASKIIAYNMGHEEQQIMKFQSEALAKMAMIRLQMDEELCFEPYNKVILETKMYKIQGQKVDKANKEVLDRAVQTALKDVEKALIDNLPYIEKGFEELEESKKTKVLESYYKKYLDLSEQSINSDNSKKYKEKDDKAVKFLQKILVPKLRKERKLLDMSIKEDWQLIGHKFPLDDVELRKPNENLIKNIMCHLLGIDHNKVASNNEPNTNNYITTNLKDDKGNIRTIGLVGGASKSKASRNSIENQLKAKNAQNPGASIYYTNTKLGKEMLLIDSNEMRNPITKKKTRYDTIYISAGSFSSGSGDEVAANRIYKITAKANKAAKKVPSKGIYENVEKPFNLYCEDINYETVLLDEEVLSSIIKKRFKSSADKKLNEFKELQKEKEIDTFMSDLDNLFKKEEMISPTKKQTKSSEETASM